MSNTAIKVVSKNEGTKIDYEQNGTKIIFGDDEIMINVAKYQRDWDTQIDICADDNNNLVIGTGTGRYYVAQIDIPAAEYTEVTETAEDSTEETENTAQVKLVKQTIDMSKVTLTLWSLDDLVKAETEE